MMNTPLVSIIIPIYNGKKEHITECINSIKNQTYKNIEVICIFDGAPEELINHCEKLIKKDNRFMLYSRQNKGVSYTRNEGIKKSNGEWITFVDADDWLETSAIETFITELNTNNDNKIDFFIFKTYVHKNNQRTINPCKYNINHEINQKRKKELFQTTFGTKDTKYYYCESVWKNFYKKSSIIKNKILFPVGIQVAEDMLFNYQVWQKCGKGYYVNTPIYNYRINDESVMNSDPEKLLKKYEDLYPIFETEIKKLDRNYAENYNNFFIKQIRRFMLIYTRKEQNFKNFKKILKNQYYKKSIKEAKLSSMNYKNFVFLLILKLKLYFLLPILSKLYKN